MADPVLVLVGPPGAGKSTVGALVADRLGLPFRDTDADIEHATGKRIAEIFLDDGEAAFRELERHAVATALAEHPGVLAVGGGAVLDAGTRQQLRGRPVVFLDVGLADAASRVGLAQNRPVLALNPRAALTRLLAERRPYYTEVARVSVDTGGQSPGEVAAAVLDALPELGRRAEPG